MTFHGSPIDPDVERMLDAIDDGTPICGVCLRPQCEPDHTQTVSLRGFAWLCNFPPEDQ